MSKWLLLVYRIPREPTAGRVFVWRKLKQLAAVALQDAVWVLPQTPRTQEQLQWLAAEITELQGEAMLWEAEQLYATDTQALRQQFIAPVEAEYREILAALKKKNRDLAALSQRFQEAQARDYFTSELGRQTRDKLVAAGGRISTMMWVTWENVGIDRIGCAWLILREIDPQAQFTFVPRGAPLPADAEPFDVPGVRFSHHGGHCSFHALVEQHKLTDPILHRIARIIDEADTIQAVNVEPAAAGLDLICEGLRLISSSDESAIERGRIVYDALYARLTQESEVRS